MIVSPVTSFTENLFTLDWHDILENILLIDYFNTKLEDVMKLIRKAMIFAINN